MPGTVTLLNALPRRGAKGRFVKGGGKKRRHRKVRARRRAPRVMVTRRSRRSVSVRAVNRVRRRRRNPAALAMPAFNLRAVTGMATNAAVGAGGAIAVDVVMGFAGRFLPATMVARFNAEGGINPFYYLTKGVLAVGLGVFGGALVGKSTAATMAQGSLTVLTYELARPFVAGMLPVGAYVRGVGYMTPAAVARGTNVRQLPNNRMAAYVKGLGTSARMREQGGTR